ncbi:MAG: polysaccharide export protein [Gammaproteobacteria bacterium]|nr:polysaccharide export protein [Gammaproteobacteria bacterium]
MDATPIHQRHARRSSRFGMACLLGGLLIASGAQGQTSIEPQDTGTQIASKSSPQPRGFSLQLAPNLSNPPTEPALSQASRSPLTPAQGGSQSDNDTPALLELGSGDAVEVKVFGRPEFDTTTYVADDGTITVPLAGPVYVKDLPPAAAAQNVAAALKDGQYLIDPQVSIRLVEFRSQQVSVLGEVRSPGRFPIDSRMTILDMLAQAGGIAETGADEIYLLRTGRDGTVERHAVDLQGLVNEDGVVPTFVIHGGDSIVVPKAKHYYVYGEVQAPNMYRLESGTTVVQAISRSGGLTEKGSPNRIEVKRKNADGEYETYDAELTDVLQSDDIVRVKERIF